MIFKQIIDDPQCPWVAVCAVNPRHYHEGEGPRFGPRFRAYLSRTVEGDVYPYDLNKDRAEKFPRGYFYWDGTAFRQSVAEDEEPMETLYIPVGEYNPHGPSGGCVPNPPVQKIRVTRSEAEKIRDDWEASTGRRPIFADPNS
jgi:hypothetical protein